MPTDEPTKLVRVRYPCGYVCTTMVEPGEFEEGDEIELTFSTRACEDFQGECVNPNGHKGQDRLGTRRHPHVEMTCTGEVRETVQSAMKIQLVYRRANSEWRQQVERVDWIEDAVFRAVGQDNDPIGHVLLPGAPEKYIRESDLPYTFLRLEV